MCGIVGIVGIESTFNKASDVFTELLIVDQLRGWDSTGLALLHKDGRVLTYKRALEASAMVQQRSYNKYVVPAMQKSSLIIGHNRAGTNGSICDENAHPFTHGDFTVVHNGHIRNANALLPGTETVDVDSMVIPRMMHEKGEKEGIELLEGGYALAWWNDKDKTFNMARNQDRPMSFCFLEGHKAMVFSSEMLMALAILQRNGVKIDGPFYTLTPNEIHKFNPANPREYQKFPFAPAAPKPTTTTTYMGGGTQQFRQPTTSSGNNSSPKGSVQSYSGFGPAFITQKIAEFSESVLKMPIRTRQLEGWASKPTKIRNAATKAGLVGTFLGQDVLTTVDSWVPYAKGQKRGRIIGHRSGGVCLVEFANKSAEDFDRLKGKKNFWAKVVNAKNAEKSSDIVLIVVESEGPPSSQRYVGAPARDADNYLAYSGPDGKKISYIKWLDLVADGCCACGDDIHPQKEAEVMWYQSMPVCGTCKTDANALHQISLVFPRNSLN